MRSMLPTSRGADGNVCVVSSIDWKAMSKQYTAALQKAWLANELVSLTVNDKLISIPLAEAKPKEPDAFQDRAVSLTSGCLHRAGEVQLNAARLAQGVDQVPRYSSTVSMNDSANAYLKVGDAIASITPPTPSVVVAPLPADAPVQPPRDSTRCVTCTHEFTNNGGRHGESCLFQIVVSQRPGDWLCSTIRDLRQALLAGFSAQGGSVKLSFILILYFIIHAGRFGTNIRMGVLQVAENNWTEWSGDGRNATQPEKTASESVFSKRSDNN